MVLLTGCVCFIHFCQISKEHVTQTDRGWEVPRDFYANVLVLYVANYFQRTAADRCAVRSQENHGEYLTFLF